MSFVCELRVRYGECDPQGHVFNPNFLAYYDTALTEMWREAGWPWNRVNDLGVDAVVAHAELDFRAPARFDDVLALHLQVDHLGTTSIATSMRVRRGDELLVEAQMRHVMVDAETWRPAEIPAPVREALQRFTAP